MTSPLKPRHSMRHWPPANRTTTRRAGAVRITRRRFNLAGLAAAAGLGTNPQALASASASASATS
ncbi:MAG: hypothetical protein AAF556_04265, partial [Pseudomonadota bacterium]